MPGVADRRERHRVRHGGRLVAEHERRWARGMTVTDPAHVRAAAVLRRAYQQRGQVPLVAEPELYRDLADYDRAFGLETSISTDTPVGGGRR
jgi:hypothetical protein